MGKFVIKNSGSGYSFNLKAGNGEIIAAGTKVFDSLDAVKAVIENVVKYAPSAAVEDQTVEGFETVSGAKFELYTDKAGETRFRLKDPEGTIIVVSDGYVKKDSAKTGIESVKKNAADSPVTEE